MSGQNTIGIFVQPNTNNVGIGTTAPRALLDVQGGNAVIVSGNVGIGTTNPSQALHVVGDILTTGTLRASNLSVIGDFVTLNTITSNTEQVVVTNAGTGPALKVTQTGANSIAEFYDDGDVLALKVADGGNVGIGTGVPFSKLHVVGSFACTTLDLTGYSSNEYMFPPQPFNNATTINNSGSSSTTITMRGMNYGNGTYIATDNGVSSLLVTTQGAWAAFDNNLTTKYQSYGSFASAGYYYASGHFVQLQVPRKVKLRRYTVYAPASVDDPKDWTLEGSNDGVNWGVISSIVGEIWSSASTKEYFTNSNVGYTHFRFRVTRVAGALEVKIYEIKYYGYEEYGVLIDYNGNTGINTLPLAKFHLNGTNAIITQASSYYHYQSSTQTIILTNGLNNGTFVDADVFRFTNELGTVFTSTNVVSGHFYVYARQTNGGGNAYTAILTLVTTGNGTSQATLSTVVGVARGTNPLNSFYIANDGITGAVKLVAKIANFFPSNTVNVSFSGLIG